MSSPPSRPRRRRSVAAIAAIALALGAATLVAGCSSESATLTDVTLPSTTKAPAKAPGDPTGAAGKTTATTADPAGGGPAPKADVPDQGAPASPSPAAQAKRTPEQKAASCDALHDFQWAMLFIDVAVTGGKLRDKLDSELDRTGQAFVAADQNWQPQIELITADLHQRLAAHMAAIADLPKGENRASDQAPNSPEVARARSELNFWRSVCPPVS